MSGKASKRLLIGCSTEVLRDSARIAEQSWWSLNGPAGAGSK